MTTLKKKNLAYFFNNVNYLDNLINYNFASVFDYFN